MVFLVVWVLIFMANYSFSARQRTRQQRGVRDDFVNFKNMSAQSFGCAHRDRVYVSTFVKVNIRSL
jgi:hypothetical protein